MNRHAPWHKKLRARIVRSFARLLFVPIHTDEWWWFNFPTETEEGEPPSLAMENEY